MKEVKMQFKCLKISFISFFLVIVFFSIIVYSQWSTDPTVNTMINADFAAQIYPFACSDMNGGAIVVWQDMGTDLYAQRVDRNGYLKWDLDGVPICTAKNTQEPLKIISDGYGGAIILWKDYRDLPGNPTYTSFSNSLYVQKIGSNGVVQWEQDGIQISEFKSTEEYGYQFGPYSGDIETDQKGGSYVCWNLEDDSLNKEIFAQYIDSSGVVLWEEWGKPIQKINAGVTIISDDSNGIYVLVGHHRLYRYSYDGYMMWDSTTYVRTGFDAVMAKDNKGGVYTVGHTGSFPQKVQLDHIDKNGKILWNDIKFVADGRARTLQLLSDQEFGTYLFWMDEISITEWIKHLVRVDYDGNVIWELSDDHIWTDVVDQEGNFITFYSKSNSGYRIYAKKHNNSGNTVWSEDSVLVYSRGSYSTGFVGYWQAVSDMEGGAMLFWAEHDNLTGNYDIMGQLVNSNGKIGRPGNFVVNQETLTKTFELLQNYPNPFNPQTTIQYQLPVAGNVKIEVYDLTGRLVQTIVDEYKQAGNYTIIWDARNVSSGIYLYRLQTKEFVSVKKCVKLK